MTLTFERDLEGRDEPPCQISTSAIISFQKLLCGYTDRQSYTHVSALPGPPKWSTKRKTTICPRVWKDLWSRCQMRRMTN